MSTMKRTFACAVAAAITAVTVLGAGPVQAAPDGDKKPARAAAVKADPSLAPDRAARARVAASPAATVALATIQARIARYVATHGTAYTFGSYLDGTTGKIVVDTNAPAVLVSSLTNMSGVAGARQLATGQVQVRRNTTTDAFHRRDDVPSFWGGAGLTAGGFLCSSGYTVANGAGTRFSVTAGHCWANGTNVLTESGLRTYGVVSDRRLPTVTGHASDMELLGGQSYAGRVYTGGVVSTTSTPVVAAGAAFVGFADYCQSGRTTGETCGHTATSTTGQVCTQTGCKSPVIVYTGGTIGQGGDSGGAFYAKDSAGGAWIRGHFIASNSTTGYVQPWTVVASSLGVSIVTG